MNWLLSPLPFEWPLESFSEALAPTWAIVSDKTGTLDLTIIPNSVAGEEELSWAKKALFSTKPCWWHSVELTEAAWAQHCCWASQGWVSRRTFLHGVQQYCGLLCSGPFSQFLPNLGDKCLLLLLVFFFFFFPGVLDWTRTSEFWHWLCLSLSKFTCISFYWSVNIGEIVSPAAVWGCNVRCTHTHQHDVFWNAEMFLACGFARCLFSIRGWLKHFKENKSFFWNRN